MSQSPRSISAEVEDVEVVKRECVDLELDAKADLEIKEDAEDDDVEQTGALIST